MKVKLDSPDLPVDHKIYSVLKTLRPTPEVNRRPYYWNAECFNLQDSRLYQTLSPKKKSLVLAQISQNLLREAYFIEKAGIAFAGKMLELSDTLQEREMYAHFASQEANHLNMIRQFLDDTYYEKSDLLEMLKDLIESGDKQCLTLVIQIMLEGYGLSHYKQLAVSCNDNTLANCLNDILKDEAQHYRSGRALYDPKTLTEPQRAWIKAAVHKFQDHVYKGPIRIVEAIYDTIGYTPSDLALLHEDLDSRTQVQNTLNQLERLIGGLY